MEIKLTVGQVFCQPIVPISFLVSFSSLTCFFVYCIKSGFTKTDKQISRILTFASSLVCTMSSIPYFISFWKSGWNMDQLGTDSNYHTAIVCFFISYLILDLALGSIYYNNKITLLTSWIHHSLYICISFWLLQSKSSSFFSTTGILELPTLLLALGSFRERWRCDLLFAFTFFVLNLVFHAYMIVLLQQRHRLETLWLVALSTFALNLYQFYGILTQQLKKYSIHWALFYKPNPPISILSGRRRRPKHSFLDRVYTI